ncbi:MAG: SMP-30/gluconolactonase/LRE family protein [Maribacter sp.]|nr:SMP-30/gluconolactonase/LRE family protein [Maribacter sp.]
MKNSKPPLTILCLILFFLYLTFSFAQEIEKSTFQILDPNAKLELLFDGGFFTEGPAVGPDGFVYFSDITHATGSGMQAGHIWKYDPKTTETNLFRSPSGKSNGIIFDLNGDMILALGADFGGRCVVRTNMQSGKSEIIAGTYKSKSLNSPNDLTIDETGRIYFTDPRYLGHEPVEQPVMGVYRIDLDGTLTRIIEHAGTPNGILISPNQKFLYVASVKGPVWSEFNAVIKFELDKDGNASNEKIFIDFNGEFGPDGMAIDLDGNLYLARTDGIYVYSAEGAQLGFISIPERPTNVTFGHGETENFLFITAGKSLFKIKINAKGYFATK